MKKNKGGISMKKHWMILVILLLLGSCASAPKTPSNNESTDPVNDELLSKLTISLNVLNSDATSDEYYIYLLPAGVKETEPGKATQSGYYGPLKTVNKQVEIDMEFNFDLNWYIDEAKAAGKNLELYVSTIEDRYLRNPLNTPIPIDFLENKDEATKDLYHYGVKQSNLSIDVTDKYPDGVISLTFPEATFVIKLEFENEAPKNSYEVTIHRPDSTMPDGIGIYRIGRINRGFQYWDTPFFKEDQLQHWSGYIIVNDFDTNARVNYEGYPRFVEFDENGKCVEGDVVTIKLLP